jgi:peptidoglycan/xylan/chitin deacetylase (PgdA/CDA1 family)
VFAAERPIVLMYHRVERLDVDPWQLAVSPENFATQVRLLSRDRQIVPMSWLGAELAAGRLPKHVAAITFDDGYSDLFRNALPVLEAENCPGTVFVATSAIGRTDGVFWWDLLSRILLETPTLPRRIEVVVDRVRHGYDLGDADPRRRLDVLFRVHGLLKPLSRAVRDDAVADLAAKTGVDPSPRERDLPMTLDQLRRMAASKVVEIGAHTQWHPSLTSLGSEDLGREVSESGRLCREWTGQPVTGFAYPYGDHDPQVVSAVRSAGYQWAVTTVMRWVGPGCDPLRVPRLLAADWDEAAFRREILNKG